MFVHQFNFTVKFVINKISEWGEMNKIIGISLYISIIITTIHKSIYPWQPPASIAISIKRKSTFLRPIMSSKSRKSRKINPPKRPSMKFISKNKSESINNSINNKRLPDNRKTNNGSSNMIPLFKNTNPNSNNRNSHHQIYWRKQLIH